MPKLLDPRMVHQAFPREILVRINNDPIPDVYPEGELPIENSVILEVRYDLKDENGEVIGGTLRETTLWTGEVQLTLAQVANNLSSEMESAMAADIQFLTTEE